MRIPNFILHSFAIQLNTCIQHSPIPSELLNRLNGKIIRIKIQSLTECWLMMDHHTISLFNSYECEPDLIMEGELATYLQLVSTDPTSPEYISLMQQLTLIGDTGLAEQLKKLMIAIGIDWEEWLSTKIGDIPAHTLGATLRRSGTWFKERFLNFKRDFTEYVQEEKTMLPSKNAIEALYERLEKFQSDIDRMDARINRLMREVEKDHS